jgi:hypothetical protein
MEQMQDICKGSVGPLPLDGANSRKCYASNLTLKWQRFCFFPFVGLLKFVFVYLANTAVLCYSLTIICCCLVQDYIYWIISTAFYMNPFWACALLRNNIQRGSWAKEKVSMRGRKWTLTDSERKMNRSEVSSKWKQ